MIVIANRENKADIKKDELVEALKAYAQDYKRAMERANLLDKENAKREQQRRLDYQKLSQFGRV